MATEILLMADVDGLGGEGDVVTVADGYARNYLVPRNLAAPVTEATRRRLAKVRRDREAAVAETLAAARQDAAELDGVSCTITVKTGEDDKLYGSVSAADITRALAEQGIELDKQALVLDQPIKELGCFDVKVELHEEVDAFVKVWVVED